MANDPNTELKRAGFKILQETEPGQGALNAETKPRTKPTPADRPYASTIDKVRSDKIR